MGVGLGVTGPKPDQAHLYPARCKCQEPGSLAGRGGQQTVRDRSIGKEGSRQTVRNRFVGRRERPTNCGKPGGSRLGLDEGSSGELSGVETLGMTIGIVDKDWDLD